MPTSNSKIFAQFIGPYPVSRCLPNDNYEIQLERQKAVLHINTLKRYIEDEKVAGVLIAEADELEEDVEFQVGVQLEEGLMVFNIGDHISQEQRAELLGVLESFGDVFCDLPGRTDLVECQIKLTDSSPCRKASYKVPYALQPEVGRQLTKMLELCLIRESDSDFSSPLVLVKKKDGSIRRIN